MRRKYVWFVVGLTVALIVPLIISYTILTDGVPDAPEDGPCNPVGLFDQDC